MARKKSDTTADGIMTLVDGTLLQAAICQILTQGGAVMFGQTRDQEKLIITVYLDGDQEKEYAEGADEAEKFLALYKV